ncbi:MAG TPA: TonB family protein [Terriglobales bacterium]|nr:TonB family protein [Terriglobales bacterium]
MYLKYYGLREEPFGVTPDPRFLYASPTYREAQATLEYGIRSGRGFTALVAKPGMGKTTLLFHLLEQYSNIARTAFIFLTQCDSREFMRYLISELGADAPSTDFVRLHEQFVQLLTRDAHAGKKVIAVVDEAQNLDVSVLETVRLLSDFETPRAKLLHIILTGQPELADKLSLPSLLQLRQRISHLVRLEPLSGSEVEQYIQHRLRVAGYAGAPLFTPQAIALIVQRSEGIPRLINNICFNALSLGYALGKRTIDADVLAEVSADLDFEFVVHSDQDLNPVVGSAVDSPPLPPPLPERDASAGMPASLPGPVLVPGPGGAPTQPPTIACQSRETINGEMGALALQPEFVPPNGTSQPPANGSAKVAPPPEPAVVDVDAIASDCALFGMDLPRRWKRPVGMAAPPSVAPAPAAKPSRPAPPVPRAAAPVASPAPTRPAAVPRRTNGASAPAVAASPATPATRTSGPKAVPAALTQEYVAALRARRQRRQITLYAAVAASVLLLVTLAWLLGASSNSAQDATANSDTVQAAVTQTSPQPADAVQPLDDAGADKNAASTVMDVIEELPQPGDSNLSDSHPAVVMRGTHGQELVQRVAPVYPAAARLSRVEGPVVLEASIGAHGFLRHIRVVSGNALLADSVLDAVRGWRYQPRMVGGRPVETPTRIVVNFQLVTNPKNSSRTP